MKAIIREDDPVAVARLKHGLRRFPFSHLSLAEVQERERLEEKAITVGLMTSELPRLQWLRLHSYPRRR